MKPRNDGKRSVNGWVTPSDAVGMQPPLPAAARGGDRYERAASGEDDAGVERDRTRRRDEQRIDLDLGDLRVCGGDTRESGRRLGCGAHVDGCATTGAREDPGAPKREQERFELVRSSRCERERTSRRSSA